MQVVETLVQIAESHGAKVNLSSPVSHITLDPTSKQATGIRLSSGEWKEADVVVVNADLVYAHNNLFKIEGSELSLPPLASSLKDKVQAKAERLVNPRLAEKLLDKPHS